MDTNQQKPYGHSAMINLGFIAQTLFAILYFIGLSDNNILVQYGPLYKFFYVIGNPIIIIVSFQILNKLKNQEIEAFAWIKILFPVCIFLGTLSVVEGLVLPAPIQLFEIFTIFINIVVLIYWNNPAHIRYFRSLK